jgi:hypothetical protein
MYLLDHKDAIDRYLAENSSAAVSSSFTNLAVVELFDALDAVTNLILRVEGNSATYAQTFPAFKDAISTLDRLGRRGNRYGGKLGECLLDRFQRTTNFTYIVCAYLLSPQGHDHIRKFPSDSPYAQFLENKAKQGLQSLCALLSMEDERP